ncbi:hypothetical protein BA950_07745 [Erythrobacter sp. SAORIC-644]|nr:hypothetical protein BA950_07745 [Erythrobacter sp. SAORIC-644]
MSPQTTSASTAEGKVYDVLAMQNGVVMFSLDSGARSGLPACATLTSRWEIYAASPAGQAQLALLLTAFASKTTIFVEGTGACSLWADTESVNYFSTAAQ